MRFAVIVLFSSSLFLVGCAMTEDAASPSTTHVVSSQRLQGEVHGGQQPIAGAHIYLLAANTTGYGGNGIAPSTLNASLSLLTSVPGSTALDASGGATNGFFYSTTDANGDFDISVSCTPGQQVYMYALGGNPGAGINSAVGAMAILGSCPPMGNFSTIPYVSINEVSTIAAAYAFAGFASDATHVSSSGTALAQIGIANAFENAANLVDLGSGTALATTPAGNGVAPQATINSLANTLAACVNTTGPSSTPCNTLFSNAKSGGSTATAGSDTATAAINIAHNSGANVAALFNNANAAAPFAPVLSGVPHDFAIAITFTAPGNAIGGHMAIDGLGNIWSTSSQNKNVVTKMGSSGALLSGNNGYVGGGLNYADGIAIDASGNAWIANKSGNSVTELSSNGTVISSAGTGPYTTPGGQIQVPDAIAIDGLGNVWVTSLQYNIGKNAITYGSLTELSSTGGFLAFNQEESGPYSIAFDQSGDVWVTNGPGLAEFTNTDVPISIFRTGCNTSLGIGSGFYTGVAVDASDNVWTTSSTSSGGSSIQRWSATGSCESFTGGGINTPEGIGIDGDGNVWIANYTINDPGISEFSNTGVPRSGSPYLQDSGILNYPSDIALDGSGNVWIGNTGSSSIVEIVGQAAPVVTPLSAGVAGKILGTRP
ncbi:hypothetical protein SAMN05421770_101436 [Granulicella rosea]|uniref:Streptogramin lyase n=1 Tax=Granulicella rosea TaxID=474952 RepID=A0A239DGN1_9BACT|nr:NHL repeat-containing protein [Granulicella rosea]SNS30933.1 hypothetical protein SAMN05421770_101436 [Granulicella rosea]